MIENKFTNETITSLNELGDILRKVRGRLKEENYFLSNGIWDIFKVTKPFFSFLIKEDENGIEMSIVENKISAKIKKDARIQITIK